MPEDRYIQHIKGSVAEATQGTLAEAEILTGATPGGMLKAEAIGLEVREIITDFSPAFPEDSPAAGAIEFQKFGLSVLGGKSAMSNISDIDCIYLRHQAITAGVATYLPLLLTEAAFPPAWKFTDPLLVPHPKIYALALSTNSAAELNARFRIGFTYVALSGPQVMEALEVWRSVVA